VRDISEINKAIEILMNKEMKISFENKQISRRNQKKKRSNNRQYSLIHGCLYFLSEIKKSMFNNGSIDILAVKKEQFINMINELEHNLKLYELDEEVAESNKDRTKDNLEMIRTWIKIIDWLSQTDDWFEINYIKV
jgi:hypothetical protein